MLLKKRVALVTGGAGHIGRAIAEEYARHGANLVLWDKVDTLPLAEQIHEKFGVGVTSYIVDLSDLNACVSATEKSINDFGGIDVLVNNGAYVGTSLSDGWAVPFDRQSSKLWSEVLQVNLSAVFAICQAAAPVLAKSSCGSIINISSIYGVVGPDNRLYEGTGMGNPAAYAASKGGLNQLTRWLSTELAPHVRVNAIAPGGIERGQPLQFKDRYIARTPMGRMATEQDIVGPALFFASDMSAYVTGQVLAVDGGWTTW